MLRRRGIAGVDVGGTPCRYVAISIADMSINDGMFAIFISQMQQ
jgi:hypothetical protein